MSPKPKIMLHTINYSEHVSTSVENRLLPCSTTARTHRGAHSISCAALYHTCSRRIVINPRSLRAAEHPQSSEGQKVMYGSKSACGSTKVILGTTNFLITYFQWGGKTHTCHNIHVGSKDRTQIRHGSRVPSEQSYQT